MSEHDDELAAFRAQFDQFSAASVELARAVNTYYAALIEEGMDSTAALFLTNGYQAKILASGSAQ